MGNNAIAADVFGKECEGRIMTSNMSAHWKQSAKGYLIFIKQYKGRLKPEQQQDMMMLDDKLARGEQLMAYEYSRIENAYESIMKSLNLPSVKQKHDVNTKMKLRF